jgi:type VI secretion system protein ImpA
MPLREDLLTPIAGDNPAGADLYYDPVFEQIKEARREDSEDIPAGAWEVSAKKKADHRGVLRLAGDALAKRSKDLRLAAPLVEAQIRIEGFSVLAPCIDLLRQLQEEFWPHLYPLPDDGEDYEMRMITVENAARYIIQAIRKVPLTRSGLNYDDYLESRAVGYEKDATSDAKMEARQDAINHDKLTAEEFDKALAGTSKSVFAATCEALAAALESVDRLDQYGSQAYPVDSPNLRPLRQSLETLQIVADGFLNERRKTEPDPVAAPEASAEEQNAEAGESTDEAAVQTRPAPASIRPRTSSGQPSDAGDAYGQVVDSALYLYAQDPLSPVPYLVCAGLRLGETYLQDSEPAPGFAVGPPSEVRQLLRSLATRGDWAVLMRESLPVLANECARAWLDLHRYIWSAGQEMGAPAISMAVIGTMRSLLMNRPEIRHWTLEDDTGAANPETQRWLDSTVLQ